VLNAIGQAIFELGENVEAASVVKLVGDYFIVRLSRRRPRC